MEPSPAKTEDPIVALTKKFDAYVLVDIQWKKDDKQWKNNVDDWQKKVQPDIDSVTNTKTWAKITLGIITVGGILLEIGIYLVKILKKAI